MRTQEEFENAGVYQGREDEEGVEKAHVLLVKEGEKDSCE